MTRNDPYALFLDCSDCGNNNFSWRNECNRCKTSKPEGMDDGGNDGEFIQVGLRTLAHTAYTQTHMCALTHTNTRFDPRSSAIGFENLGVFGAALQLILQYCN